MNLPREDRLLLDLLGRQSETTAPPLGDGDWEIIIERACEHGVAPVLYHHLSARGISPPEYHLQLLRTLFLESSATAAPLEAALGEILAAFAEQGISAVLLKGSHLAVDVYGSFALRPMGDLDLLLREGELESAAALLRGLGYRRPWHQDTDSPHEESHHLSTFVKEGPAATHVELHRTILRRSLPYEVDAAGLRQRARPVALAGVETLLLAPEDLVLHLALHAACHHYLTLGVVPFVDIDRSVERYAGELDWDAIVTRAGEWKAGRAAALVLHLGRELLGTAVPGEVIERLDRSGSYRSLVELSLQQIFRDIDTAAPVSLMLAGAVEEKSPGRRAAAVARGAFPPLDEMAKSFPAAPRPLLPFLYPLRLLRFYRRRRGTVLATVRGGDTVAAVAAKERRSRELARALTE